ncbi:LOW QUALITY PROTEIN: uncharacterized protein LOC124278547 [Haliotis rubra]|uniref:LOW QUALITY PROTEIN: uncharacterized protein LOC124278547 n=1 Tax=Haliotis rubra TaxID=36100 RepID=UPI001EE5542D|nr:LOW QUALITY PROTEIN: uncharacterized protein LOC124278547 [Haliotis rubra]
MADKRIMQHTVAVYTLYILVCRWTSAAVHYRENPEYLLELCDTKLSNDVKDEGCREAKNATLVKRHTFMSSIWCAKQCWKDKFKYSLVKRGDHCLCSQVLGNQVDSQKCNIPCPSAKAQNCGGYHVVYVLCTGFVPFNWRRLQKMYNDAMKFKQKRAHQRTKTMAKYDNGKCIKWTPKNALTIDSQIMTVEMCVVHCFHYKYVYAMLTLSTYCKCTSDSPEVQSSGRTMEQILERGEKTSCTRPCGGNRKQICGGAMDVNSVHLTGHYGSKDHVSSKEVKKLPALESHWKNYFLKNKDVLLGAAKGNGIVLRAAASTTPGTDVDILDKGSGHGNITAKVVAVVACVGLIGVVVALIVVIKRRKKETPGQQSHRGKTKSKRDKKSRRSGKRKKRSRDMSKDGSKEKKNRKNKK